MPPTEASAAPETTRPEATRPETTPLRRGLAWGVHGLTASGAVVGVLSLLAIQAGAYRTAAIWMLVAFVIDSVDGTLARRVGVSWVVPRIDGRRLDDVVDFLNYVIVPAVFFMGTGTLSHWAWVAIPVLASAYGFSQVAAKTDDEGSRHGRAGIQQPGVERDDVPVRGEAQEEVVVGLGRDLGEAVGAGQHGNRDPRPVR
ncbi:MAG: CDP-alcohol phosphatidyltransferase family protein, partial [Myxococcota bacterium]|nr:CDP-alcohol phosphatidyltransferase family protein [Myxococcota bacterium]